MNIATDIVVKMILCNCSCNVATKLNLSHIHIEPNEPKMCSGLEKEAGIGGKQKAVSIMKQGIGE